MSKNVAIILAAGSGKRMQGDIPKQFMKVLDKEVLVYSLEAFEKSKIDELIVVSKEEYFPHIRELVAKYKISKFRTLCKGGSERYHSVYEAIKNCAKETNNILIHDGARPLISTKKINELLEVLKKEMAAVLAVPVKDTIRQISNEDKFSKSIDRASLYAMHTPQGARFNKLALAYDILMQDVSMQKGISDDVMVLWNALGVSSKLVIDEYTNIKLTTKEDIFIIETYLKNR